MDFKKAIDVALSSAKELLPQAKQFSLEEAIVANRNYEITLSYVLNGDDPLEVADSEKDSNLFRLAKIMGTRRQYKIFLVDEKSFNFKGFRAHKETV